MLAEIIIIYHDKCPSLKASVQYQDYEGILERFTFIYSS